MIQIYTGDGKGKSTAAFGLAIRAAGAGLRVYIGQFLKGAFFSEIKALRTIKGITVEQYGSGKFVCGTPSEKEQRLARTGFASAVCAVTSRKYDVVILDELNCAVFCKLIDESAVLELMRITPRSTELVITGRGATARIMKEADLVSDIKCRKHYYDVGLKARKGIEC
ncbi:MAG TPA: cob(I)yrinic acid a,c-diamide adenosyltransferase [Candidatus Omnitrophota bacterium]|nr:cob(I)yrinic acid a,c-diamide adenosyltransferase [Candidatus Omnitrophota bacterium]HPT07571.1 cob(I)yrinic acid a,c-diamide adenosyltransferase [Candidatus Omnitrophota bacterium]